MWQEKNDVLNDFRAGNLEAFNRIYFLYAPKIYGRILRLVKKPDIADEILQEVFLKVWAKRAEIDPDKGFVSFLNRISDNISIDFFRKSRRDAAVQMELWAASVHYYFHTEEKIYSKEAGHILQEAIDTPSPRKREILKLCKLEERSYKEVADMLGISVSSVSNQLVASIKDIKRYITKYYGNEFVMSFLIGSIFFF